jgi:hypothetical protein
VSRSAFSDVAGGTGVATYNGGISGMRNKVLKRDKRILKLDDSAPTEFGLALSLIPFIHRDDDKLPREQFLRLVMDRIVNNLSSLIK